MNNSKFLFWFAVLFSRLILLLFLSTSDVGLMPDEAQYWTWSQFLSLGYYSKPPAIAWQIALGTALFGNTELGIRFISLILPVFSSLIIVKITEYITNNKRSSWLAATAFILSPIGMTGSILATTDNGLILFWLLATLLCLREKQLGTGLMIAIGALWKWMIYILWIPIALCRNLETQLATYRPAESSIVNQSDSDRDSPREQPLASSRSEPSQSPIKSQQTDRWQVGFEWKSLLISLLGVIPTLWWNYHHDWATFRHVGTAITGSHATGPGPNPGQFFLANLALLSPLFALLALPSLFSREKETRLLRTIFFIVWGGIFLLSFFRKIQGNWAVAPLTMLFPLIGITFSRKPSWQRWPFTIACSFSLILQALILSGPYIDNHLTAINPLRQGIGSKQISPILLEAGYNPKHDFLFSDRYQTTSLLWFYGPKQRKTYFLNIHGLRNNQFLYWPGMPEECKGKTGYFIALIPSREAQTIKYRIKKTIHLLSPYFEQLSPTTVHPILSLHERPVRYMIIIKAQGYNGLSPKKTKNF